MKFYMKQLLLLIILFTFFSCKKENESIIEEVEIVEDSIRTTICHGFGYDYNNLFCKNEFCDTGICVTYENIWKELFLEKNNLNNEYFDEHITICKTGISEWDEGFSFSISFIVTYDWAKSNCFDSFIIKIHEGNNHYPHVDISRGVYLSKQEITIAIYYDSFSSHISKISDSTQLKYVSIYDALNALIDSAKVDTLCITGIKIDGTSGNLNLEAAAEYVFENNSCVYGNIDLFTGETKIEDSYCYIDDCW